MNADILKKVKDTENIFEDQGVFRFIKLKKLKKYKKRSDNNNPNLYIINCSPNKYNCEKFEILNQEFKKEKNYENQIMENIKVIEQKEKKEKKETSKICLISRKNLKITFIINFPNSEFGNQVLIHCNIDKIQSDLNQQNEATKNIDKILKENKPSETISINELEYDYYQIKFRIINDNKFPPCWKVDENENTQYLFK